MYISPKHIIPAAALALLASCGDSDRFSVGNPSDFARTELAEIPLPATRPFRIIGSGGEEVPYQVTSDSTAVFEVSLAPGETAVFSIAKGHPSAKADTAATGRLHPERFDDFAWENDRAAYRAYGPALRTKGERAYGYDVWTKKVPYPVAEKRYHNNVVLRIPYHDDLGDGMDAYTVGPSLGGGAAALIDSRGRLVYPWTFAESELLDNGPLRVKFRLTYPPVVVDGDTLVETRTISLDKGSFLNQTTIEFAGLSAPRTLAPGIVVHRQNPFGYTLDPEAGAMTYTELTDRPGAANGVMFLGLIAPEADSIVYRSAESAAVHPARDAAEAAPDSVPSGDAAGHILAIGTIRPGGRLTYHWGSGWSKGYMPDSIAWAAAMRRARAAIAAPLVVCFD